MTEADPVGRPVLRYGLISHESSVCTFTDEELNDWLAALAQYSDKIAPIDSQTFSRETIYQDQD